MINHLMGENFLNWISYLKVISSPIIGKDLEFENLNSSRMNFAQTLNNIAVSFLLNDAVKKNGNQVST